MNIATGQLQQVSQQPGFHLSALSADGLYLLDQFSGAGDAPITAVLQTDGLRQTVLAQCAGPAVPLPALRREFVTLKAHDGIDLYAQLVKPVDFDPVRYPVVVHWYGGPACDDLNRYGATNIFNSIERDVLYRRRAFWCGGSTPTGEVSAGHAFETPIFGSGRAALDDNCAASSI